MIAYSRILWSQLRIGLVVSLSVTACAILVFFIDDVRDAVEDRYSLHFHTSTTQALRPRALVWLAGQPVGYVRSLTLDPPTRGRAELLHVELSINTDMQSLITEGAAAQVISASLLGEPLVNILPTSDPGPPLLDGDELPTCRELDPFQVSRSLQVVYDSIVPVRDRWRQVFQQMQSGRGTLPLLARNRDGMLDFYSQFQGVQAVLDTIRLAAEGFSDLMTDEQARAAFSRIGPRLNELRGRWTAGGGSVGSFARDTVLEPRLDAIAQKVSRITDRLVTGRGTLGRLQHDRALADELAKTRRMLQELRDDLRGLAGNGRTPP